MTSTKRQRKTATKRKHSISVEHRSYLKDIIDVSEQLKSYKKQCTSSEVETSTNAVKSCYNLRHPKKFHSYPCSFTNEENNTITFHVCEESFFTFPGPQDKDSGSYSVGELLAHFKAYDFKIPALFLDYLKNHGYTGISKRSIYRKINEYKFFIICKRR